MNTRRLHTELLAHAGRLLLEYNESTGETHRTLAGVARSITDLPCHVILSYGNVTVSLAGEPPVLMPVRELRYNTAVQARVHTILDQVRCGELEPNRALARLRTIETDTPRYAQWLVVLIVGITGAGLARLLGADYRAVLVAGLSTALGLLVRQELGRRHFSMLALPLSAAFIAAVLGGLAIRLGWTGTPELIVIVPALMLIPGTQLINALLDLMDNHLEMSVARLTLATGILLASSLGVVLGVLITLPAPLLSMRSTHADHLNLVSDMILAGMVTCGFALSSNTAWGHVGMAAVGGMAGHGLYFLAEMSGCGIVAATFLGGLCIGLVSAWMARSVKTPFAAIAFSGAITMIPGLYIYRALAHALQAARLPDQTNAGTMALDNALHACLVLSALTVGLILGARTIRALAGGRESRKVSTTSSRLEETGAPARGDTLPTRIPELAERRSEDAVNR
jgi:uncharacterized membrane protein YjjP (DUF1212 family)